MRRIGIDTGGTFSDLILLDEVGSVLRRAKVPSTPDDPARAVAAGLERLLDGEDSAEVHVVVGTTVATNAVIERRGPRVLFVSNAGFTDVPFIGRMDKRWLYDLHWSRPRPLVRRRDCLGVGGRLAHDGAELDPVSPESLTELVSRLRGLAEDGEEVAIAVCLLFAYVDDRHEAMVAEAIRAALPAVSVSVSHEVSPLWREYERASTTIADAFVKPVVDGYVNGVGGVLDERGAVSKWNLMASNGGYLSSAAARDRPAQLLLSGLAGARSAPRTSRVPPVTTPSSPSTWEARAATSA